MKPIERLKRNFHAICGHSTTEQNAINRLMGTERKVYIKEYSVIPQKRSPGKGKPKWTVKPSVWISNVSLRKTWAVWVIYLVTSSCCTALSAIQLEGCLGGAGLRCFSNVPSRSRRETSSIPSSYLMPGADFLPGRGCINVFFFSVWHPVVQISSADGRSDFCVCVPVNFIVEITRKKIVKWH